MCSSSAPAISAGNTAASRPPPRMEEFVAMRVNALVVDLALLGRGAWEFLEKVSAALPGLGHRGLHRAFHCFSARARPAHRGRRLGDQAMPSRGGPRARRGRGAAPQAGLRARGDRSAGGRRARDPGRPVPGLRPLQQRGSHPARVRGPATSRPGRGQGAPARGDLPGGLGLRDGPRRPLGRRVHPKGAPEARGGVARLAATSTRTSVWATASIQRAGRHRSSEPLVPEAEITPAELVEPVDDFDDPTAREAALP